MRSRALPLSATEKIDSEKRYVRAYRLLKKQFN